MPPPIDFTLLLSGTVDALHSALAFEIVLREHIVRVLSPEPSWWKRRVPGEVSRIAQERRERDKSSKYAASYSYHQIYYCYLEQLQQILQCGLNAGLFTAQGDVDLRPRMQELISLRNRAAHARLLSPVEARRVHVTTTELRALLKLPADVQSLTLEDPAQLRASAVAYLEDALRRALAAESPTPPTALSEFVLSPSIISSLDRDAESEINLVLDWLSSISALKGSPGYRIEVARAVHAARESGIIEIVEKLVATLRSDTWST